MGHQPPPQPSLFYTGINLDKRIRADHVLRKVARMVDFDFVYQEVKDRYWSEPHWLDSHWAEIRMPSGVVELIMLFPSCLQESTL